MKKIDMGSYQRFEELVREFQTLRDTSIHKYASSSKTLNSTGDMITNVKNTKHAFDAYDCENVSYAGRVFALKDAMDVNNTGLGSELMYEYVSGGKAERNLICALASLNANNRITYSGWCGNSENLFGCIGLRNKQYCILNKQYTKEEYEALAPKIIAHMNDMPYKDNNGREYRYSEFFPIELSPFPYNDSVAHEFFNLRKDQTIQKGYWWRDPEAKNPVIDIEAEALPDHIRDVTDEILEKTIGCCSDVR